MSGHCVPDVRQSLAHDDLQPAVQVRSPSVASRPQPPTPWAQKEPDPEHVLAELRKRFPNAMMWWGEFTGSYWSLACTSAGDRLLEAATAEQFAQQLTRLHAPESVTNLAPVPQAASDDPVTQLAIAATTPIHVTPAQPGHYPPGAIDVRGDRHADAPWALHVPALPVNTARDRS